MTEKIKLTKEQSNGLEVIKKLYSIDNILKTHAKANEGAWIGTAANVNDLSLSDLATALIVGYEVEMTPGEIIKAEYQKAADERTSPKMITAYNTWVVINTACKKRCECWKLQLKE